MVITKYQNVTYSEKKKSFVCNKTFNGKHGQFGEALKERPYEVALVAAVKHFNQKLKALGIPPLELREGEVVDKVPEVKLEEDEEWTPIYIDAETNNFKENFEDFKQRYIRQKKRNIE